MRLADLVLPVLLILLTLQGWAAPADKDTGSLPSTMTLHVVPVAHIDLAWWWRYDPETVHVITPKTLQMAFNNLEAFPDYTFTFLQVPLFESVERSYPDFFYKIHYYLFHSKPIGLSLPNPHGVNEGAGRFKIVHGLWCEIDGSVPGGESIVRQCLHGKRYFKYKFGIDVKTAWFQDAWTHPWTYPQILKKSGIDSYMFTRGQGGSDERMFWWESADGSRVFAYKPASFGGVPGRERWERELREVWRRYGVNNHIALMGVGDHGGGAPEGDIAMVRQAMSSLPVTAKFSTAAEFLGRVLKEKSDFPVVRDEISPTLRGAYTTVGEIKKGNRKSEILLLTLEKFASIASVLGEFVYPDGEIRKCWEKVMLNQFHDTISGTDTPDATDDALRLYQEVMESTQRNLTGALAAIASRVDTRGKGIPLVVFNPLSWTRNEPVEFELNLEHPLSDSLGALDPEGQSAPLQIVNSEKKAGRHVLRILLGATGVPSLGYKTYRLVDNPNPGQPASPVKATESSLENENLKVRIDPTTGLVTGILDKSNGREVLVDGARGNLIQIIEDFGDSEGFLRSADGKLDPEHKWTGEKIDVDRKLELRVVETGPVRAAVEVRRSSGFSRFIQRLSLCKGSKQVEFELMMDWKGLDRMVKVAFPLAVSTKEATYEIPYGTIVRPNLGEEQNARRWVDLSDADYGVSLMNDSRYGYDVKDNVIRLSMLRSPHAPAFATDERDRHKLRYGIYPHAGGWRKAGVMRRAYEFNEPLIGFPTTSHEGDFPLSHSFVRLEPEGLILEVLKKAEDSHDLILRFYDTAGRATTARLNLSFKIDAVHAVDLIEHPIAEIQTNGTGFESPVKANSIESYKLIRDR